MSRRKILLADDSITIQKVVNLTFADEGIDVVTVGDGDAALEYLSSDAPDILLADVNMPGPTGYEICERLRQDESTRNLPVILLVGSFEPFDEAEATRVGANAYLTKPFQSIRQLIEQVNELIEASRSAAGDVETGETVDSPSVEPDPADTAEAVPLPQLADSSGRQFADDGEPEQVEERHEERGTAEPRHFDDLGYSSNVPSTESASPPSDDIEGLYSQSLSGDEQADLSDIGIDDEMIETSYTAEDATPNLADFGESAGETPAMNGGDDHADASDTRSDDERDTTASQVGFISGYDQRFPDDPSKFVNTIAYENWQPADMREGNESQVATDAGVSAERSEQIDHTKQHEQLIPGAVETAAESSPIGDDTIRMENRFDATGSGTYEFEDIDLLDLAPSEERPVEITSQVNAREQGSNRQVVTLSPELIEMIAQRVVEKMSEKY